MRQDRPRPSRRPSQDAERRGRILGVRLPPRKTTTIEPWTAPPSRRGRDAPIGGELPTGAGARARQSDLHRQGGAAPRRCGIACFASRRFRTRSSTRRRRCACPRIGKPRVIACAEDHRAPYRPAARLPRRRPRSALATWAFESLVRDERYAAAASST
ncbi:MAG: hypothetical protein MZW92_77995 [Comamonadaceae bacterium]|nr:hypothetical protein [Comamonadaceae bacterium]